MSESIHARPPGHRMSRRAALGMLASGGLGLSVAACVGSAPAAPATVAPAATTAPVAPTAAPPQAAATAPPQAAPSSDLIKAAQKEGTLTFYTAFAAAASAPLAGL